MNESISRAAGAKYGQEMAPEGMRSIVDSVSLPRDQRQLWQRTTLYAGEFQRVNCDTEILNSAHFLMLCVEAEI